jgi:transposase
MKKIESSWNRCWKRKCRAALKDNRGKILDEFFFSNNSDEIIKMIKRIHNRGTKKCNAVLESTGNMWMRIHDTLEDNGIDTILANTFKTKIIAQSKIKSDKLDARILSDLLRTG